MERLAMVMLVVFQIQLENIQSAAVVVLVVLVETAILSPLTAELAELGEAIVLLVQQ
jgi:hypothetical protein